jgi:type II secretory pathway pseudopilin PulG
MKSKKGISLIVLIITIIVVIILAAAVIITINKNNPVDSAKEATFKEDVKSFQDDLALTVAKEYTDNQGQRDTKINAKGEAVKDYIPSFKNKYVNKFAIVDDNLVATDKVTENEKLWIEDLNLNSVEPEETNYTSEEIESSEYLYAIGKTKPEYVVAKFNNDYTEVVITKNGEESDGIIQEFAVWTISSPMSDKKDTLKKAVIKEGVTDTGSGGGGRGTFGLCSALEVVELPNSLIYINNSTFVGCENLRDVTIPESVIKIGNSAFDSCISLKSITIPENVEKIDDIAFCDCKSLENVNIKNGSIEIGHAAFQSCISLKSITIPESVTSIRQSAFGNCSSLTNITYKGTKEQWNKIDKSIVSGEVDWCDSTLKTITCTDGVITL